MVTEGQEFLRSKHGVRNTYNQGDALNALRWDDRARPPARRVMGYYQQLMKLRASKAGCEFPHGGEAEAGLYPLCGEPGG